MALQSMTALASITLQEASASVTFSGIPQNYRDLILVINGSRSSDSGDGGLLRFNGDSGSNYSYVFMLGNGSSTNSGSASYTGIIGPALFTGQGMAIAQIMDYSATDKHKTVVVRRDTSSVQALASAERWANTAAISSIVYQPSTGTHNIGTTLNLYGRIA
jgi:hypothetical protein